MNPLRLRPLLTSSFLQPKHHHHCLPYFDQKETKFVRIAMKRWRIEYKIARKEKQMKSTDLGFVKIWTGSRKKALK
ncbi:hypothetical protein HanIR_Chr03g0150061 [Helianthus annuus]|nr:hypothetical protein HanIR_Chr03g0150061 [Helianthus annuus]